MPQSNFKRFVLISTRINQKLPTAITLACNLISVVVAGYGLSFVWQSTDAQLRATEAAERTFVAAQRPVLQVLEGMAVTFDQASGFKVSIPVKNVGGGFARHITFDAVSFVADLDRPSVAALCPQQPPYALKDRLASETLYAGSQDVLEGRVETPARRGAARTMPFVGIAGRLRYISDVEHVWHCATVAVSLPAPLSAGNIAAKKDAASIAKALTPLALITRLTLAD